MRKIGITTTVPIEIIFAAGALPVDLNNAFITANDRRRLLESAESAGFPGTCCSWIKGLYQAARDAGVEGVVGVMAGDCSNTHALVEIWQFEGMKTYPFAFPYDRSPNALRGEMERLCEKLGADFGEAEKIKTRLDKLRKLAAEVDRLTWEENRVTGLENHLMLVNASDFYSDTARYEAEVKSFLEEARKREPLKEDIRLGYIGVPSIFDDLYQTAESLGARVVFNEVQRQFALPYFDDELVAAYLKYTYPYDVFGRIEDIKREIERRRIDGIINYTQSFCFRQMEDVIFKKSLGVPVLTIEGDRPMPLDPRTRTRLESFIEMLGAGF